MQIARETGRKLAILPKDVYLLKTVRLLASLIPDIARDKDIVIYQETTASKSPAVWLRKIHEEYEDKVVLASDVRQTQKEFILCFSFFDLNELPSIRPKPGSLYVFSYANPMMRNRKSIFGVCIKGSSISVSQLQLAGGKRWQMADTGRGERLTCFGACLRH